MKKIISDGGRKQAGINDRRDCTVRALAHVAGIPYDHAHRIMTASGRRQFRGASMFSGLQTAQTVGVIRYAPVYLNFTERVFNAFDYCDARTGARIKVHKKVGPTITQFVREHREGRYIVRIKKHVVAIIDGVLYDAYEQHGGALVCAAWKITPGVAA